MAEGDQSGSVVIDVFAGHDVGVTSYLVGGAAADSAGADDFVRCYVGATGTARRVWYVSKHL